MYTYSFFFVFLGIRERELKRSFISIMQTTYDSQGKIIIEEGNKELTTLNGEILDEVTYTHGSAPAPDHPNSWNVHIAQRVDLALLEQVSIARNIRNFRLLKK